MDISDPMRAVTPTSQGPVLGVLIRAGEPLTGRRIADLTSPRVSQSQVATVLRALVESGLVTATPAGRANLYAINRDHLLYEAVLDLASARQTLWARMTGLVADWAYPAEAVVVFGSAARGDGDVRSDIDVLVVRPESVDEDDPCWQADLDAFSARVHRWTGNGVDLLSHSPGELAELAAGGERLLTEIRTDGRFLVGSRSAVPAPAGAM